MEMFEKFLFSTRLRRLIMAPCGMKALSRRALKGALWAAGVVLAVASLDFS